MEYSISRDLIRWELRRKNSKYWGPMGAEIEIRFIILASSASYDLFHGTSSRISMGNRDRIDWLIGMKFAHCSTRTSVPWHTSMCGTCVKQFMSVKFPISLNFALCVLTHWRLVLLYLISVLQPMPERFGAKYLSIPAAPCLVVCKTLSSADQKATKPKSHPTNSHVQCILPYTTASEAFFLSFVSSFKLLFVFSFRTARNSCAI